MNDLGKDRVGSLLIKMALPAILAQVINLLYSVVDRMYIGHIEGIGSAALTGVGITFPLITLIMAFSSLVCMGGAPRAAIYMGKGEHEKAEKVFGNCVVMLLIVSAVLTAVILIFKQPLLYFFGASDATVGYGVEYISVYAMGTVFVQISMGLNAFINTQGHSLTGMMTILIGAVLNIILDPFFIFVLGLGVRGAAIATVISQGASAVWVACFLLSKKSKLKIRRKNLILNFKFILPVITLGLSPFIMQSTESLISICFNKSLQSYGGDIAVGTMTILVSVMQFVNMPIMGLTQGAQPIISFNYGARQYDRVKKAFWMLFCSAMAFSLSLWLVVMFLPSAPVKIFTSDPELIKYAVWAIKIYMAASFILGIQNACQQTFVALGQAGVSMFLAILRKIILLIPLIFILPNFFADKVFAVFLAEPISDTLAVATTATMFMIKIKKILKTPLHANADGGKLE